MENRRFSKVESLLKEYPVARILLWIWILTFTVLTLYYNVSGRELVLSIGPGNNTTTDLNVVYELDTRVDFGYLCEGFLYEADIDSTNPPVLYIPEIVGKFLKASNYSISAPREILVNRTVPHFITVCKHKTCLTYSSREFCEILLTLGGG